MHIEEFKEIVFPLKGRLYRFARWMLDSHEDAEDVTQEVFLKLWTKRNDLKQYKSLEALAFTMTKNLCLNYLKSKHRLMTDVENGKFISSEHTPEATTALKDSAQIIFQLIQFLPIQQRLVLHLRDVQGMEMDEIVMIAKMSLSNVRATLSLARKRVRELYIQHYGTEGK